MKYPDSVSSLARLPGFPVAYWGRSALQLPLQSVDYTRFLHSDVSIQFYGRFIHVSQEYHTMNTIATPFPEKGVPPQTECPLDSIAHQEIEYYRAVSAHINRMRL